MKDEEAIVGLFFEPAQAGQPKKYQAAEALIREAPEAARWRLTRLLGAIRIVHAAMRGEAPPIRWQVVAVRSRKQRNARVERARQRAEAAAGTEPQPDLPTPAMATAVPATLAAPSPAGAPACPRCGGRLIRVFATAWSCERCGGQVKGCLPGVAP